MEDVQTIQIQFNVQEIFENNGILDIYNEYFSDKEITTRLINKYVADKELNRKLKSDLKNYFSFIKKNRTKGAYLSKLEGIKWFKLSRLRHYLDPCYLKKNGGEESKFGGIIRLNGRLLKLKGVYGSDNIKQNTKTWNAFIHRLFEIITDKELLDRGLSLQEICAWVITNYEDLEEIKYNGYQFMLYKLKNKVGNYRFSLRNQLSEDENDLEIRETENNEDELTSQSSESQSDESQSDESQTDNNEGNRLNEDESDEDDSDESFSDESDSDNDNSDRSDLDESDINEDSDSSSSDGGQESSSVPNDNIRSGYNVESRIEMETDSFSDDLYELND